MCVLILLQTRFHQDNKLTNHNKLGFNNNFSFTLPACQFHSAFDKIFGNLGIKYIYINEQRVIWFIVVLWYINHHGLFDTKFCQFIYIRYILFVKLSKVK